MKKYPWYTQQAINLIEANRDTNQLTFETGYGPSGLPHLGTFAEVVRTMYVINAAKRINPMLQTKLIVFSDDMDGLRSCPDNVPNRELIYPHVGKPLSSIPDPFKENESYSEYMNNRLRTFLDSYGFSYTFLSSTNVYSSGAFDIALRKVMDNYEIIHKVFTESISEDKRESWSPFFPICTECGSINNTRVRDIDKRNYKVTYTCDCGASDETSILGGKAKVGWKVDWAMRWFALNINYEMHGKDLMSSASMSRLICKILGGRPPQTYKYELFLDEDGSKISKKIGNGVTMEQWMTYAPPSALLHFLCKDPNKSRKLGLSLIPIFIDDYLIDLQNPGKNSTSDIETIGKIIKQPEIGKSIVSFNLLVSVARSLSMSDPELLYTYAEKLDPSIIHQKDLYIDLCKKALLYYAGTTQEHLSKGYLFSIEENYENALNCLIESLTLLKNKNIFDHENIQKSIFSTKKKNNLDTQIWFKSIYHRLTGSTNGPRLGPLMEILGFDRTINLLSGEQQ